MFFYNKHRHVHNYSIGNIFSEDRSDQVYEVVQGEVYEVVLGKKEEDGKMEEGSEDLEDPVDQVDLEDLEDHV